MQRTWFALAVLALAACASKQQPDPGIGSRPTTMVLSGASGTMRIATVSSSAVARREVAIPIDSLWRALPAVFDSLKIPVTTVLTNDFTMGNDALRIRRSLGGVSLPNYLNCGGTMGMPNADTYDIQMSLLTQLQKVEGSDRISTVVTVIDATARPNMGSTSNPVACTSTGRLEDRIFQLLRLQFKM